jgi:D-alanyl-D-alanine carboxypeptidase
MQTGWLELGATYLLKEDGAAYTGWLENEEGLRYFHPDGRMAIGRVVIDETVYYFTSTGKRFVLTNIWNPVPDDYETELTEIDGFRVSVECYDALVELIAACEAAGNPCKFTSIYRSYNRQVELFEKKVNKLMGQGYSRAAAEKETAKSIAVPGTSEHQLGLAVDLKNGSGTYRWLAENSWKYGFIMRYPSGKTEKTGIYYEPWHYRYVGTELAKELYDLGLCVEEYMEMLTERASNETAR